MGNAGEDDSRGEGGTQVPREVFREKRHKRCGVRRDKCPIHASPPMDSAEMFRKGPAFLLIRETFGLFHSAIRKGTKFRQDKLEAPIFHSKQTKGEISGDSLLL